MKQKLRQWWLFAFNLLGFGAVLWLAPWALTITAAWITVECAVMRSWPKLDRLRNFGASGGKLMMAGYSAAFTTSVVSSSLRYIGGPFIRWDADELVGAHPWSLVPLSFLPIFVTDVLFYLWHRVQHAVPFLWRFHSVHHSDIRFDVTTGDRVAWPEWFAQAFYFSLPFALLNVKAPQVAVIAVIWAQWGNVIHNGTRIPFGPFTPLFAGMQYHRIHHSIEPQHRDKNFAANFPILDILGGTYYRPAPDEWPATGVEGMGEPGILGLIIGQSTQEQPRSVDRGD